MPVAQPGFAEATVTKSLTPAEYQAIHDYLERQAGIRLGPGKEYLVISRLARLLPSFDLGGFGELVERLYGLATGRLHTAVVDAMTSIATPKKAVIV